MLVLSPGRSNYVGYVWGRGVIKGLKYICGIDYRIEGRVPKDDEGVIIASKHQSAWETIFFLALFKKPAFILKRELCVIPIYGWYLRPMGMIAIDRTSGGRAIKHMYREVHNRIACKRPVIIFPEGTRVPVLADSPYKAGIMAFYPDVTIVPVALNSGEHWPRKGILKYPGTIVVRFLAPLPKEDNRAEALSNLKAQIDQASDDLSSTTASGKRSSERSDKNGE